MTPAADAAVCQCGHGPRDHYRGVCHTNPCCGSEKCDNTFVADANRPETCAKCFHPKPPDGSCAATTAYSCAAASDRGAGELADLLAAHTIECTGPGEVTCRGCRDDGWMSWTKYRAHVAAVLIAAGWEKR